MPHPTDPVGEAVASLRAFGVDHHTSTLTVRTLLRMWARYADLTPDQREQVITAIRDGAR